MTSVFYSVPATGDQRRWQSLLDEMATSATTAAYYSTAYLSKVQPQFAFLWKLLHDGRTRLLEELQSWSCVPEAPSEA